MSTLMQMLSMLQYSPAIAANGFEHHQAVMPDGPGTPANLQSMPYAYMHTLLGKSTVSTSPVQSELRLSDAIALYGREFAYIFQVLCCQAYARASLQTPDSWA